MGKATLLLAFFALFAGGSLMYQSQRNSVEADGRQSDRDEEILAREIARSGHNMIMSQARQLHAQNPSLLLHEIVAQVNGADGKIEQNYQGGSYEAWLVSTSPSTVASVAIGKYGKASHRMQTASAEGSVGGPTMPDLLEVTEPSELTVTFLESMAGYCSGIYLERILPDVASHLQPAPELIFAPGNNRDGAAATFSAVLDPGTRMNFILAVDADFNCEKRNVPVSISHWTYDYTRPALITDVEDLVDLQEGKYAMIQERPGSPGIWRIAFEDLVFSDAKLADVKANGYGSTNWHHGSYGGTGWSATNGQGYFLLNDYGHMPDFSDQVIEIELTPVTPS